MRVRTPSCIAAIAALVFLCSMSVQPPSALPAAEPLQIAWAGPLTGDVAQLGQGWLNGVKLAVDEWNAKGGVLGRQVVIAPEDDQCDPKQAATVATKIADDPKNVALIGHFCSGATLAGAPIENKANLPQIVNSSNPKITQQGWHNLFRPIANDNVQGKRGVAYVIKKLNAKKFALLNDKQAFGQGVTDVAKQTIESMGGTVTSTGGVEPKDVDYSPVITKIVQTESPDAIVYCTNFPTSAGLMLKQIRQAGFKKPVVGCDGWFDPAMIKAAGSQADMASPQDAAYITFQAPPYSGPEAPAAVKAFAAKYKAKFNSDPNGYEIYGYEHANIMLAAIKAAGSTDKQKIIDVLHKQTVPGILIPRYRFDANGDVVDAPLYIYTVSSGAFKLVVQATD
jgi:branched-chain amino acid transport system substrate-binding protein